MKRKKEKLFFLIIWMCILGGWIFYIRQQLNDDANELIEKIESERLEVYNQPGFFDPFSVKNTGTGVKKIDNLVEQEFKHLEGVRECRDSHLDIYREDAEEFFESIIPQWQPGEWSKVNHSYYVVEYEDGRISYCRESTYYSCVDGMNQRIPQVILGIDAASDRIHNINIALPYKDNMRKAFAETVELIGYASEDGGKIFDKMYDAIRELGDNERISYIQDGYSFYLMESDFDDIENMKKDKYYDISISLAETAEIQASEVVHTFYAGEYAGRKYFDIRKEDAEAFFETRMDEWGFDEWVREENQSIGTDAGGSTYNISKVTYLKSILEDGEAVKSTIIQCDGKSGRLFNLCFQIGDEIATKNVFCEVVEWLKIPLGDAGSIYDQMYNELCASRGDKEILTNDVEYFQEGYRFYMAEVDENHKYGNEIVYWVSISPE